MSRELIDLVELQGDELFTNPNASPPDTLDWMEGIFWSQKDGHQSLGLDCHDYGGLRHGLFKLIAHSL